MDEFKISQFNTVKGRIIGEISIEEFANFIENKAYKYWVIPISDYSSNIWYKANVYKKDENNYQIDILEEDNYGKTKYHSYVINTTNSKYLSKKLDELSNETKKHEFEKTSYKKIETEGRGTTEENKAYLNYLNNLRDTEKKYISKNISYVLWTSLLNILAACAIKFYLPFIAFLITMLPAGILDLGLVLFLFDGALGDFLESIEKSKLLTKKIEQIERKLAKSGIDMSKSNSKELTTNSTDIYKDGVIKYMNSIRTNANHLENGTKKQILLELKAILDEYTIKCKKNNESNKTGLSLDNKRIIIMETIDKLAALEMKLADLRKEDNDNKTQFKENEELMKVLENDLSLVDNQTEVTPDGKVRKREKIER